MKQKVAEVLYLARPLVHSKFRRCKRQWPVGNIRGIVGFCVVGQFVQTMAGGTT